MNNTSFKDLNKKKFLGKKKLKSKDKLTLKSVSSSKLNKSQQKINNTKSNENHNLNNFTETQKKNSKFTPKNKIHLNNNNNSLLNQSTINKSNNFSKTPIKEIHLFIFFNNSTKKVKIFQSFFNYFIILYLLINAYLLNKRY